MDQKLIFLFSNHKIFGLLGKITSRGELSQKFIMSNYSETCSGLQILFNYVQKGVLKVWSG